MDTGGQVPQLYPFLSPLILILFQINTMEMQSSLLNLLLKFPYNYVIICRHVRLPLNQNHEPERPCIVARTHLDK